MTYTNLKKRVNQLDPIKIFNLRLNNKISRYPQGLFENKENCIKIIKYLIEEKLHWSDKDICSYYSNDIFKQYNLSSMLSITFNDSPYKAINTAYPNKFKPWQFQCCPKDYWTKDTGIKATKWLLEEKLKWSDDEICSNLTLKVFKEYKLRSMINTLFNGSPYEALNAAYPNKFKPWQVCSPKNFWNKDTAKEAIKWLIEDKLNYSDNEISSKLTKKTFQQYKLDYMLNDFFDGSPYNAINAVYPNKFKPWQLPSCPKNYWTKDTAIEAIKWLIEDELKCSDDEVFSKLTKKIFKQYRLTYMLNKFFDGSTYKAINAVYPNKFIKKIALE